MNAFHHEGRPRARGPVVSFHPQSFAPSTGAVRGLARSPVWWACALACAISPVAAQTEQALPTVVVTGNPLRQAEPAAPVVALEGDALASRRGATLGETLDGLPGVSSSYFGPNASRPVIRGLDGDRLRVLQNSGASVDASSLSFDHAVPLDPLVVERVEVLRGPAALMYGGSAVGGVVNALDNRIPRAPVSGVTGSAELRAGGAASQRGGSALLEAGDGRIAVHADAFSRETEDLRVPRFVPRTPDGAAGEATRRIENSQSHARGGALGASLTFDRGYLGASVDTYRNDYGVVVEPEVAIRMRRERRALAGEWRPQGGWWRAVRMQWNHTDYRHDEVEGEEVGTRFRSQGADGRLELVHRPWAALGGAEGVVGLQVERSDFAALGEEAFVPSTRTRSSAVFVLEEWTTGALRWSAGVRREQVRVGSDGDAPGEEMRFAAASERRFGLGSASLGLSSQLAGGWRLGGSVSYTERAPTFYELYARGVHVATGAYERGDPAQRKERGTHLELTAQWKEASNSLKASAFASRFSRFIALEGTGEVMEEPGEDGEVASYPVYAFRGVRARFHGVELEARRRVAARPARIDLEARLDWVRASNADTGEPLPRISPARLTLGAQAARGPWQAGAEVQHAARQSRVPGDDVPTPSYTLLHLHASYRVQAGASHWTWFVQARNLTNRLAYNAASIRTVRELAPLPGRALHVGLRASF